MLHIHYLTESSTRSREGGTTVTCVFQMKKQSHTEWKELAWGHTPAKAGKMARLCRWISGPLGPEPTFITVIIWGTASLVKGFLRSSFAAVDPEWTQLYVFLPPVSYRHNAVKLHTLDKTTTSLVHSCISRLPPSCHLVLETFFWDKAVIHLV